MSATTLNLHYVQIMSATSPPPPFRLIWLVQIMSATPSPCFYVFIHPIIWLSITTIDTNMIILGYMFYHLFFFVLLAA